MESVSREKQAPGSTLQKNPVARLLSNQNHYFSSFSIIGQSFPERIFSFLPPRITLVGLFADAVGVNSIEFVFPS